ncbi:MAG TPA: cbb3-type cytochrome c oxidase subunit I [Terriglobales bacterium]
MSTRVDSAAASSERRNVLQRVFSTDHRTIARQYFWLALAAVLIGLTLSVLMRIHLVWPDARIPLFGVVAPETYLAWLTIHGSLMVFFVLTTAPVGCFGNLVLAEQIGAQPIAADGTRIGAPRMAFPALNALSFWTTLAAFLVMLAAFFVTGGAPVAGWTAYPPLSAIASAGPGLAYGMDCWLLSLTVFCFAQIFQSINFIATPLRMRAKGMTLMRMPLTVWNWFVTASLSLIVFSALLAALVLMLCDRHLNTSFFVPSGVVINGVISSHKGGSPLLWQHLFWFFGHPEVYIAILPGMGIVSIVLSTFARKPVFGYKGMVVATVAIAFLGSLVWGHHMFTSGMSPYAGSVFALMTLAVAVPSSVKVLGWIATLWGGRLRFDTPLLYSLGFLSLFIAGGLTGPLLAQPVLDQYVHDTYFVVAHFHLIMAMAAMFTIFAALHYWSPLLFKGRMLSERLGRWHFWLTLFGAYAVFMPMHWLGIAGHPRRYAELTGSAQYVARLLPLQRWITYAALVLASAQLLFLWNLVATLWRSKQSEDANPWQATTLEWIPASQWMSGGVRVERGPCDYEGEEKEKDFTMQHEA